MEMSSPGDWSTLSDGMRPRPMPAARIAVRTERSRSPSSTPRRWERSRDAVRATACWPPSWKASTVAAGSACRGSRRWRWPADMSELPVFTVSDLEAVDRFEPDSFVNDDAVALGLVAVSVIRKHGANLAVRIVLRGDVVFLAKLGTTGPGNDVWLAGKAAVAERFGEPSLLVRRRHEAAGTPFEDRDDVDHESLRAHGGAVPIFSGGEVIGTITMSGEPDVVDHALVA